MVDFASEVELAQVVSSSKPGAHSRNSIRGCKAYRPSDHPFEPSSLAKRCGLARRASWGSKGLVTDRCRGSKAHLDLPVITVTPRVGRMGWPSGGRLSSECEAGRGPGCFATAISTGCAPFVASGGSAVRSGRWQRQVRRVRRESVEPAIIPSALI